MSQSVTADYDKIGLYEQNEINGLTEQTLQTLLDCVEANKTSHVLDAMGGDGNLTMQLLDYCQTANIKPPHCTLLEISQVQTELARAKFPADGTDIIWGDLLTATSLNDDQALKEQQYDRIMVKSANHEIPLKSQETLHRNLFRLLKPGGKLINLGFVFDSEVLRDEVRVLAEAKDTLAGMKNTAINRHFLLRDEYYACLSNVGFKNITNKAAFNYHIRSEVVANNYFAAEQREALDLENQAIQAKQKNLRQHGHIVFTNTGSILKFPGEITVCEKPDVAA